MLRRPFNRYLEHHRAASEGCCFPFPVACLWGCSYVKGQSPEAAKAQLRRQRRTRIVTKWAYLEWQLHSIAFNLLGLSDVFLRDGSGLVVTNMGARHLTQELPDQRSFVFAMSGEIESLPFLEERLYRPPLGLSLGFLDAGFFFSPSTLQR